MEEDSNRMHESSRRAPVSRSDSSSSRRNFMRSASLSTTGTAEGVPRQNVERMGISGDRGACEEMVGSGSRQNSLNRMASRGSWRRGSISLSRDVGERILGSIRLSRELADQILGDVDSSMLAQVGDSGSRDVERGLATIPYDAVILPNDFETTLAEDTVPPLPVDTERPFTVKDQMQRSASIKDKPDKLPPGLDHVSYLIHLAVFGILGVVTRYLLQKLFGPGGPLAFTGDSPLYLDLPSNLLGSFLMGWFGFVFKAVIREVSDQLAVGLTTGYLGSLTTFSGWNQKMLGLSSKSHWVQAIVGIIFGMFDVYMSIVIGVGSAERLHRSFLRWSEKRSQRTRCSLERWRVNSFNRHIAVMTVMLLLLILLWVLSGVLARAKLDNVTSGAILWLGCLVGPPGVWIRWYLARLNGQGLGTKGRLKWLPIGTLSANVLAACLMAALATISNVVNTKKGTIIISGVQLGFLGCLSTVSTFIAEVYAMTKSGHGGRAFAYILITFLLSFALGTLIYSVPVWTKHYN